MTTIDQSDRPATASEVRALVGARDDSVITSIVALGATRAEVLEALAWLSADEDLHRELHHVLHDRAAQVFEILEAELSEQDRP